MNEKMEGQVVKLEIFKLFGSIFVDTTDADEKIAKTDEKRKNIRWNFRKYDNNSI